MIIGNGLIANAFKNSNIDHSNLIIFASGVSNSKEIRLEEYERELKLLTEVISQEEYKKLIYFSSCSVSSTSQSEYNKYKSRIELFIQEAVDNYLILKLPNVVGKAASNNQLVNYFYNSLLNQREIILNTDCIRHLIDVADLPSIVELLVKLEPNSKIISVAFDNGVSVNEIIRHLESALGATFNNLKKIQSGNDYYIDNQIFLKYLDNTNNYNTNPELIIKKYYANYEA